MSDTGCNLKDIPGYDCAVDPCEPAVPAVPDKVAPMCEYCGAAPCCCDDPNCICRLTSPLPAVEPCPHCGEPKQATHHVNGYCYGGGSVNKWLPIETEPQAGAQREESGPEWEHEFGCGAAGKMGHSPDCCCDAIQRSEQQAGAQQETLLNRDCVKETAKNLNQTEWKLCQHCNQPIQRGPGGDLYALVKDAYCPQNHRGVGHELAGAPAAGAQPIPGITFFVHKKDGSMEISTDPYRRDYVSYQDFTVAEARIVELESALRVARETEPVAAPGREGEK